MAIFKPSTDLNGVQDLLSKHCAVDDDQGDEVPPTASDPAAAATSNQANPNSSPGKDKPKLRGIATYRTT
eukprot:10620851-Alexandrium_andersonii.AAC.1